MTRTRIDSFVLGLIIAATITFVGWCSFQRGHDQGYRECQIDMSVGRTSR